MDKKNNEMMKNKKYLLEAEKVLVEVEDWSRSNKKMERKEEFRKDLDKILMFIEKLATEAGEELESKGAYSLAEDLYSDVAHLLKLKSDPFVKMKKVVDTIICFFYDWPHSEEEILKFINKWGKKSMEN